MLTAHFIGNHDKDTALVRAGWFLTRVSQKGINKHVTHCEAILDLNADGTCTIASSSLRDGGVRTKHGVRLNPAHWMIVDVPLWDVERAKRYFREVDGYPYDVRGALATVLPGTVTPGHKFCCQAVGEAVGLVEARTFGPGHFASICLTFGRNISAAFFSNKGNFHHGV